MSQQINLYQYLPKPEKKLINFKNLAWLYLIFVLFLVGHYFYLYSLKKEKIRQLDQLALQLTQEQNRLQTLKVNTPVTNVTEIQTLQVNSETKLKILKILSKKTTFSNILLAFSKTIIPGVWITNFNISENGKHIEIKGKALQAVQAQKFSEMLNHDSDLMGIAFGLKEVNQESTTDKKNIINFLIVSKETP